VFRDLVGCLLCGFYWYFGVVVLAFIILHSVIGLLCFKGSCTSGFLSRSAGVLGVLNAVVITVCLSCNQGGVCD